MFGAINSFMGSRSRFAIGGLSIRLTCELSDAGWHAEIVDGDDVIGVTSDSMESALAELDAACSLALSDEEAEHNPEHATREEMHGRYIDTGPGAWDEPGEAP